MKRKKKTKQLLSSIGTITGYWIKREKKERKKKNEVCI